MLGKFFKRTERGAGAVADASTRAAVDAAAVAAAIAYFESTTGQTAHPGGSSVIGTDDRGAIVRVRYGHMRPHRRVWYQVAGNGAVIAELSLAEVAPFGERPWR